ncbi:antibiotic biosynthesis monooxygenase [Saccharospirillum sp. HFRX-1]|uniref:putative quinol monooxygenase n=1 Tax=unclassified Saccharospirillum TaxID=2633430 RepID=UPI003716F0B4
MPIITLTGYIDVPIGDLDSLLAELPTHIDRTRAEAGCLDFRVEQDPNEHTRFTVYEVFASETAFALHQQNVKASRWGAVSNNVIRNYRIQRS